MEEIKKFKTEFVSDDLPDEKEIKDLIQWFNQFHKNNLRPNLSFRIEDGFVITADGLEANGNLSNDSLVGVINYDVYKNVFYIEGKKEPSIESVMHFLIYNTRDEINAIFNGHHDLILKNAEKIKLPVTKNEQSPGSMELANEVLDILGNNNFVVIRNHGFVSLGRNMKEAGELAIKILKKAQSLK
jgi:ribulose-5-phosphate 4-epimerase/fuculose-1-phosphate aldolase